MIDDIFESTEISNETKLKILDYIVTYHISDLISESKHNILKIMLYVTLLKENDRDMLGAYNVLSFTTLLGTIGALNFI